MTQRHQAYCRARVTEAKLELAEEVLDFSNRNIQLTMEILIGGNGENTPLLLERAETRLLKTNESTQHIPIVALTAHALVTDRERAFEAGCDDYDTKPVDFERLSEKIENLLVANAKKAR